MKKKFVIKMVLISSLLIMFPWSCCSAESDNNKIINDDAGGPPTLTDPHITHIMSDNTWLFSIAYLDPDMPAYLTLVVDDVEYNSSVMFYYNASTYNLSDHLAYLSNNLSYENNFTMNLEQIIINETVYGYYYTFFVKNLSESYTNTHFLYFYASDGRYVVRYPWINSVGFSSAADITIIISDQEKTGDIWGAYLTVIVSLTFLIIMALYELRMIRKHEKH